jgi:hypothetical protein
MQHQLVLVSEHFANYFSAIQVPALSLQTRFEFNRSAELIYMVELHPRQQTIDYLSN